MVEEVGRVCVNVAAKFVAWGEIGWCLNGGSLCDGSLGDGFPEKSGEHSSCLTQYGDSVFR